MKAINIILLALLVAAIIAGMWMGAKDWRDLRHAGASKDEFDKQLTTLREKLTELTHKQQGLLENYENVPDSLRASSTGPYWALSRKYKKQIAGYNAEIREAQRQKRKSERAFKAARNRIAVRSAILGTVVVVLGGLLYRRRMIRS